MTLTKCLTKSNMAIKITPTKQLKSASPTKMKRYLHIFYENSLVYSINFSHFHLGS